MPLFKSTPSQDDLVRGCIRNDRRTQELLYRQYLSAMHTICISYARNQEDAGEILQDGFLKIFQNIERFDQSKSTLYTWMRTIMVRTAIDFLRRDKNEPTSVEWEEHHDSSIDADVIQKMTSDQVLHLLRSLPETTRAVFNLYVTEGYSHKEIGQLLNISDGTSKWHLSEARKKLTGNLLYKATA